MCVIRRPIAHARERRSASSRRYHSTRVFRASGNGSRRSMMGISQELLEILACPKCKGDLELTAKQDGLVCKACKLVYRIEDDIPIMLIDEAVKLDGGARAALGRQVARTAHGVASRRRALERRDMRGGRRGVRTRR